MFVLTDELPEPSSSYERPVPVITASPTDSPNWTVCFNSAWLPYVLGALFQLSLDTTWDTNDKATLDSVQDKVALLIDLFVQGCPPVATKIIGTIIPYVSSARPTGTLECDGTHYLKADYPALSDALGATYSVDATHFKVPDLMGRVPVGKGHGASLTDRAMNAMLGEESHALTIGETALHTHPVGVKNATGTTGTFPARGGTGARDATLSTAIDQSGAGGNAHNNMQPSTVIGFCIVYQE